MDAATETTNGATSAVKPPYGGHGTFRSFIDQMHDLYVAGHFPQVIDRSVMGQRGGSARSELYIALRFFGLIDDEKRPTPRFADLAANPTVDKLRSMVEEAYAPLIAVNLNTATARQVDVALADLGASPSTVQRARTFFLNAADETGIPVGQLLRSAPRAATSPRRRSKPKSKTADETPDPPTPPTAVRPPLVEALVAKLPAELEGWNEDDARQWLALIVPAIAYDYKLDVTKLQEGSP